MRYLRSAVAMAGLLFVAGCQDQPVENSGEAAKRHEVRSGWILGPGSEPTEVRFSVINGRGILEGDIDLGPADSVAITREELVQRTPGPSYGVVIDSNRWTSPINYTISSAFSADERQVIVDALNHVQNNARGVTFHHGTASNYIEFVPASTCQSPVGWQGGRQEVRLTAGCVSKMGIVSHEILHALGMWHEQSRCDRDSYVQIYLDNVISGEEYNFDKHCTNATDVRSYDEGSVMHYGAYAFSANGEATIVSLRGLPIGQRDGLSATDVSTLDYLFPPPPATYIEGNSKPPRQSWQDYTVKPENGNLIASVNWYRNRVLVANTVTYSECVIDQQFELLVDIVDVYGKASTAYMMVYPDFGVPPAYTC